MLPDHIHGRAAIVMAISWNRDRMIPFSGHGSGSKPMTGVKANGVEANMVRDWVEAASVVLVVAVCYMMIVPI
jgi:hypothetical protein